MFAYLSMRSSLCGFPTSSRLQDFRLSTANIKVSLPSIDPSAAYERHLSFLRIVRATELVPRAHSRRMPGFSPAMDSQHKKWKGLDSN